MAITLGSTFESPVFKLEVLGFFSTVYIKVGGWECYWDGEQLIH